MFDSMSVSPRIATAPPAPPVPACLSTQRRIVSHADWLTDTFLLDDDATCPQGDGAPAGYRTMNVIIITIIQISKHFYSGKQ